MSQLLAHLLDIVRSHDGFPELLKLVERPRIQPARLSEAEKPEAARFRFIYQSGQAHQHDAWIAKLTGKPTETE